jgi:hypothetical protein
MAKTEYCSERKRQVKENVKIILSRKGFDSSNGGCASPIFPDGRLVSFPIPASSAPTNFSDVGFDGLSLGELAGDLSRGKVLPDSPTHLDPDLSHEALPRRDGWLPAFGQTGAAQSHLNSQGVEVGDLFLFFGWFKRVEKNSSGRWTYVQGVPDLHVIFGWLQVGEVLRIGAKTDEFSERYPWLARHPHVNGERSDSNTIYLASPTLKLPGQSQLGQLVGGGAFGRFSDTRRLSAPNQPSRSLWHMPAFFAPSRDGRTLSYHSDQARWKAADDGWVELQSVAKGQEFVLDCRNRMDTMQIHSWLESVFQ